ncbi:MAG: diguanylate cyclase, partial [Cyanobacteria bacterium]|nr:diguanylate cyclase [Cyanobacteria bacterium GSL.Bin21]
RVFSRNTIIDQIWTSNCYPTQGAVTNLVKDLRRQFKRAGIIEEVIETVFGLGYRLKASSDPKVEKSSEKQEQGSAAIAETLKTFLKNPYQEDWLTQDSRSELSTMAALSEQCASCRQTTAQPNAKKNTSATHSFKSSKASWPILPHQAEPKTELLEATAVLVGDSVTSRSLSQFLKPWGIAVIGITNPQALWNTFITLSPHLLVLDLDSDTSDNIKLCREIVTDPDYQELPILVLTNQTDPAYLKQLLATGINDFINKPIVGPEVVSRVVNCLEGFTIRQQWLLQCSNYRKLQQTNIDALTQLPNRYLFECHLQHVWKELSQKQEPIVLILSEIDDFQRYLSCCGYAVGNKCLQKIAQTLQQSIGLSGSVARYGKTEFAILLPSTQLDTALSVTQKIQQRMTELNTQQRLGVSEPLTMSMGIVGIVPPSNQTVKALIKTAAHALATAKTQGRNTYCVYSL